MTARILDGKEIGRSIRSQIRREIEDLVRRKLGRPKLAVILVGEDAGSQIYVRNKERACAEVGIETLNHHLPPETSQETLLELIARMNEDPSVNGVLVQLPLPKDIDDRLILQSVDPEKDVDGFHPLSYGKLVLGVETLSPATPAGVIAILEHACLTIEGQHVVIVGASQIVGKPLSALFVNRLATVTVCHLETRDLKAHTLRADILVSATGVGGIITADMVHEGAVVIDVGISRVGQKLVGDVDFEKVKEKASAITPVPGGVGPMTVTMLLVHTLRAYRTQALARELAGENSGAMNLPLTLEHRIYKVSELTREIRGHLETGFFDVRVEGEVSNLRSPGSGHLYFTLKDEASQLRAVIFKSTRNLLRFHPEEGMAVRVRGGVTVYEPRGEYQILVEHLEPIGRGALEVAFQQLKERLAKEGLFDAERKKPLPFLPRRIGVVTSLQGAAIRDILVTLYRRDARLQVLIAPSRVQGQEAASEIAEALSALNQQNLDLVIVGRGGGSVEDLWAFNEEPVARAIAASRVPVISAIGHEWDLTIADFVADVRAPTPSAAAVLAVHESDELEKNLLRLDRRLLTKARGVLEVSDEYLRSLLERRPFRQPLLPLSERRQRVDDHTEQFLRSSRSRVLRWTEQGAALSRNLLLAAPTGLLKRRRVEVSALGSALGRLARQTHRLSQERLSSLASRLQGSSPLSILGRGYSICRKLPDLEVLREASATGAGQKIRVDLARGHITCAVEESHPQNSRESFHGGT